MGKREFVFCAGGRIERDGTCKGGSFFWFSGWVEGFGGSVIGCMCRRSVGAIQNYHAETSRPLCLLLYAHSLKPIKQEPALDNGHRSLPLSPPTLYE
jgi:hypothetical protein